jgi:spermidine synthase
MSQRRTLLLAFGMCMFTALVYEVIWTRHLNLVFGTSIYAFSAVLSSFMMGLALGAYYFGKEADKSTKLLNILGKMQFALAVYAALLIGLFKLISYPYFMLFDLFGNSLAMNISMFFLAFVILFIPTALIGAVFPIVSKIYIREIGHDVSTIYGIDTIFSGFGALFAGFICLPYIGLIQTTFMMAAINLILGYIFIKLK